MVALSIAVVATPFSTTRHLISHKKVENFSNLRRYASQQLILSTSTQMEQTKQSTLNPPQLQMTYLEGNSWLWEIFGVSILVDPVLVGNLDFGVPLLYDAAKKTLTDIKLEDFKNVDFLLITQGLDDHCHKNTLEPLSTIHPGLSVVATPNAEPILSKFFRKVTYIEPGESTTMSIENKTPLKVTALAGPVLGPPWQRPENGYILETEDPKFTMYYEPHCISDRDSIKGKTVDLIVTPVVKQRLPLYTLVSGQEDAVQLSQILKPRYVVTMKNGNLEAKGLLSKLVKEVGTTDSFKSLLGEVLPETKVLDPKPGVPFQITI